MPWPIKEVIADRFNADVYIYAAVLIVGYIILKSAINLHFFIVLKIEIKDAFFIIAQKDNVCITENVITI